MSWTLSPLSSSCGFQPAGKPGAVPGGFWASHRVSAPLNSKAGSQNKRSRENGHLLSFSRCNGGGCISHHQTSSSSSSPHKVPKLLFLTADHFHLQGRRRSDTSLAAAQACSFYLERFCGSSARGNGPLLFELQLADASKLGAAVLRGESLTHFGVTEGLHTWTPKKNQMLESGYVSSSQKTHRINAAAAAGGNSCIV